MEERGGTYQVSMNLLYNLRIRDCPESKDDSVSPFKWKAQYEMVRELLIDELLQPTDIMEMEPVLKLLDCRIFGFLEVKKSRAPMFE